MPQAGVNLGFLDGHAAWTKSQMLVNKHAERTNNMGGWSPEMGVDILQPVGNAPELDDCGFAEMRLY